MFALLSALAAATSAAPTSIGAPVCPPPGVRPMEGLNTTEFVRASWFIQQQQVTEYLPKTNNYCVVQTLEIEPKRTVPFFKGPVISVYNYALEGSIDGKPENDENGTVLCARQTNASCPAQIINAPCFLPNSLAGDYWVIAAGPTSDHYEWIIVSGGPPTESYPDGCTTKLTGVNGAGLWLFSRSPVSPVAELTAMRSILTGMGYTLSQLNAVTQQGCKYDHALIKPNKQ